MALSLTKMENKVVMVDSKNWFWGAYMWGQDISESVRSYGYTYERFIFNENADLDF